MKLAAKHLWLVLPLAVAWAAAQERKILCRGDALDENGLRDAVKMGVRHPEKIRLLGVEEVPFPCLFLLKKIAAGAGIFSPHTVGMSLRYGIYLRKDFRWDRMTVAHECVHTSQYEREGGIAPFLRRYLRECLEDGYDVSELEQEAVSRSKEVFF